MFSALGDLIQGPREKEEEEELEEVEGAGPSPKQEEGEDAGPSLSFWGMATALRDSVKQRTAELAASIQETDWRKELGAFQQGLKEDTEELQHRTKEAVEQLPTAVEQWKHQNVGTSATLSAKAKEAQQLAAAAGKSLGTLGHKLVHGTSELFDQIKDAIQNEMAFDEPGAGGSSRRMPSRRQLAAGSGTAKYSRFEADVSAMQRDSSTYCDEPEDEEDYAAWLATFDLAARRPDIDALIASNTFMAELQSRIVPLIVEYDAFWTRYFYRLHKLQQKHEQFVQLTQRAIQQDEEEVGWGSDEEHAVTSPKQQQAQQEEQPSQPQALAGEEEEEESHRAAAAEAAVPEAPAGKASPEEQQQPQQPQQQEQPQEAKEAPAAAPSAASPTAASAPAAAAAISPPLSDDGVGTISTTSEVSQVSGGTPERWTVVGSPRAAAGPAAEQPQEQQQEQQQAEKASGEGQEGAKEESSSAVPAPAAPPAAKAAKPPATASTPAASKEAAAPAAAAGAAVAAAAAAAAAPAPSKEAAKPAAGAAGGEESDLSDFDVGPEDAAAGGDDIDESWGDDWE